MNTKKLTITGSKKAERKPYLAQLLPVGDRKWADKQKGTSTSSRFTLAELSPGDVVEFRASLWDGSGYTYGGVQWAVITDTGGVLVSRSVSQKALDFLALENPIRRAVGSDFRGDTSGGLTEELEAKLRDEHGGDFLGFQLQDGETFIPEPVDDYEERHGTMRGNLEDLQVVTFCGVFNKTEEVPV